MKAGASGGGVRSRGDSSPCYPSLPITASRQALRGSRLQASAPRTAPTGRGHPEWGQCGEHWLKVTPPFSLSRTEERCARVFTASESRAIIVRMLLDIWGGKSPFPQNLATNSRMVIL